MNHIRNVPPPFDRREQRHARPRDPVLVPRDADDANLRRGGVVFYYNTTNTWISPEKGGEGRGWTHW